MIRALLILALIGAALALAEPAQAAFPGANGKITFNSGFDPHPDLFTINPDGTGETNITNSPEEEWSPAWRADGQKLAFTSDQIGDFHHDLYVMNPDGTGRTNLTNGPATPGSVSRPTWSPDGTKIAFEESTDGVSGIAVVNADGTNHVFIGGTDGKSEPVWSPDGQKIAYTLAAFDHYDPDCECDIYAPTEIFTMNADGSGQINITNSPTVPDSLPDWSPDGTKIVFTRILFGQSHVYVMNADGTGQTLLPTGGSGEAPTWSPDGKKIVFMGVMGGNLTLFVMNADGSGRTPLTTGINAINPDWQPLPTAVYEHPQSAPSLSASLVPTFRPCGTGANPTDGQHSPPLGTQACLPPTPGSNVARVGSTSVGTASFTAVPGDTDPVNGDQADVTLTASLSDVKTTGGADYTPNASGPDLTEITRLRFTDKANNYGGASATATEYDFRMPLDCAATSDPSVGSTCSTSTSADSLLPGFVIEQRQTVVQAFRVRVDDAGANGTTGDSDDRIFATQGIYIP
jgi:Tol biopolymer transport system component